MSSRGRGATPITADVYCTPRWCIEALGDHLDLPALAGKRVLDPSCGDGRIGALFARHVADVTDRDLERGEDYLAGKLRSGPPAFDLVVTNPPFSHAAEFIRRGVLDGYTLILLLRVNILGARCRLDLFREHPPAKLITLVPRPRFAVQCPKKRGGCGQQFDVEMQGETCPACGNAQLVSGSDSTEYGWLVWGDLDAFRDHTAFAWGVGGAA